MAIPIYSTIALITEILISAGVLFTFYSGFKKNKFPYKLVVGLVIYETLFNISYMALKLLGERAEAAEEAGWFIVLAASHGILSLIMFISLLVFLILAWKNYKKGKNYFKIKKGWTVTFLIFWLIAVLSGILIYLIEYVF